MRCPECGEWMYSTTFGYYCDCGKVIWASLLIPYQPVRTIWEITEMED